MPTWRKPEIKIRAPKIGEARYPAPLGATSHEGDFTEKKRKSRKMTRIDASSRRLPKVPRWLKIVLAIVVGLALCGGCTFYVLPRAWEAIKPQPAVDGVGTAVAATLTAVYTPPPVSDGLTVNPTPLPSGMTALNVQETRIAGDIAQIAVNPDLGGVPTAESGLEETSVLPADLQPLTPKEKCDWLQDNVPQTPEALQAKVAVMANVVVERVSPLLFDCQDNTDRYAGAIILGSAEGKEWTTSFTITVPESGVVDADDGSTFTGTVVVNLTTRTRRGYNGSVTTNRATVWFWDDERVMAIINSNAGGGGASLLPSRIVDNLVDNSATVQSAAPTTQDAWRAMVTAYGTYVSGPDSFGGIVIDVTANFSLPADWEATTSIGTVSASETNRTMVQSERITVYPPRAWRTQLGFAQ